MQDEEHAGLSDENPPADAARDPSGPPEAVEANDSGFQGIGLVGTLLIAAGGLVVPLLMSSGTTCGATRSAKIQWQQRQEQIEQAARKEFADRASSTARPMNEDAPHDGHGI